MRFRSTGQKTTEPLPGARRPRGILRYLLRDARGATMPMMGMAIIPLAGLVGGAVDMSRMYITKTRLQQACDAGALAGRKVMGGGTWAANGNAANTAAVQFFDANFANGAYGTTGRTRAFSESAGRVSGTASATVPMTIMKIFRQPATTITVACSAEMRLPNTDVMFVLDTTGSMGDPIPGESEDKIVALRRATKCFYEIVAQLATTADCGPDPSGGLSGQVQVRFGFVPYSVNVNVGRLLPTNFIADRWSYQSRRPIFEDETYYTFDSANGTPTVINNQAENVEAGSWETYETYTNQTSSQCTARTPTDDPWAPLGPESAPYNEQTQTSGSSRTVTWNTRQDQERRYDRRANYNSNTDTCRLQRRIVTRDLVRTYQRVDTGTERTRQVFRRWRYELLEHDISGLKNGSAWNAGVSLPIGTAGAAEFVSWNGCIEERETTRQTDYSSTSAKDLDLDMVPSSGVPGSFWGPALRDAVFTRGSTGGTNEDNYRYDPFESTTDYGHPSAACPTEAKKLQVWSNAAAFEAYVDSLNPTGNTYHDIGMIWGGRLMSPTGIFQSENAFTPQGGQIERHMIFMTDGQTCTDWRNYNAYGLAWFDRRQTDPATTPSGSMGRCSGGSDTGGLLTEQVDARFAAMCTQVKARNITLWVVYFGTTDSTTQTRMKRCASNYNALTNTSDRFFYATDTATLLSSFRTIASQISQLRLTQ